MDSITSTGASALRVALITDPGHPALRPDDVGLPAAFEALGASAQPVAWGSDVAPELYDVAVIRTPWDYFLQPSAFLAWVDALTVPVLNPAHVIHWNHHKGYLLELQSGGYARLPGTLTLAAGERGGETAQILAELETDRAVVKPAVSGGAHGTRVLSATSPLTWAPDEAGEYLVQAFVDSVELQGEWSLIYLGGELSHCVLKTPKAGDFRVQDDFGGTVLFDSAPAHLIEAGGRVLDGVLATVAGPFGKAGQPGEAQAVQLPYVRIDLVEETATGGALLMEVELIEPELFLRADPRAPERFARAVLAAAAAAAP